MTENLWRLGAQEDTDGDQKVIVHDQTTPFQIRDAAGGTVRIVTNTYPLSILLQDLKQADNEHRGNLAMNELPLEENIVDRTHRFIKTKFWDALTRRIDGSTWIRRFAIPRLSPSLIASTFRPPTPTPRTIFRSWKYFKTISIVHRC